MNKLFIPGPVQPSKKVLDSFANSIRPHFGTDWSNYYKQTVSLTRDLFSTVGTVHLLVGSGSAGLDACVGSCLETGDKIIIGVNGYFGERLKEIAVNYGINIIPVESPWGKPINPDDIKKALVDNPDAKLVAVVHLETSTTIINPIQEIGEVVRKYDKLFLVDAVSSLGGMPFFMDDWNIDISVSASQKCIGSIAGLAVVAIGPRCLEEIRKVKIKNHGWYLNLNIWNDYTDSWKDWHPHPVTMATSLVIALRTSLEELFENGIDFRFSHYQRIALYLRHKLREINLEPFTSDSQMAPVLTAIKSVDCSSFVRDLDEGFGIKVAGGLGQLSGKIFRIGHMSPSISVADIDELIFALGTLQNKKL